MTREEATQLLVSLRNGPGARDEPADRARTPRDAPTPAADEEQVDEMSTLDQHRRDLLFNLTYEELRQRAHYMLRRERRDHTLQTTALVHEAYLKLFNAKGLSWSDRTHFCRIAAAAMRQVLINWARARGAAKRGGQAPGGGRWSRVDLTSADGVGALPANDRAAFLIDLDESLTRLEARSPRQAQVVELNYFAGLTQAEIGEELGVAERTVQRDLKKAQAWLKMELERRPEDE